MAIAYPIAFPAVKGPVSVLFRARSAVGLSVSPFTFGQQAYAHAGEAWEVDIAMPPMARADAEAFVSFLLALSGRRGTFLFGDPVNLSLIHI